MPPELVGVIVTDVETSPALLTDTVRKLAVVELAATELAEREEEETMDAGANTERPVCSESEIADPPEVGVPCAVTVIWLA